MTNYIPQQELDNAESICRKIALDLCNNLHQASISQFTLRYHGKIACEASVQGQVQIDPNGALAHVTARTPTGLSYWLVDVEWEHPAQATVKLLSQNVTSLQVA
jgi:hypothetical protein